MSSLRIAIRADASIAIGSGHVMRCLTLACWLTTQGAKVIFISRALPGNLIQFIENNGFTVYRLTKPATNYSLGDSYADWLGVTWQVDADEVLAALAQFRRQDWLVVDNYALDFRWEQQIQSHVDRVMVIDDLANRRHDCNLLLDQNLYPDLSERYLGLVPDDCMTLLGPRHALLRPEFLELRQKIRKRDGHIYRIMVFFGGSDGTNETEKALTAIEAAGLAGLQLDVVVGSGNPHQESIKKRCRSLKNCQFHWQISNMAELMTLADLAIGAGGATTWERCALGLPSVVIVIADNQYETAKALAATGSTICLGRSNEVSSESLAETLKALSVNPAVVKKMGQKALEVMNIGVSNNIDSLAEAIWRKVYAA